MAEKPAAERTEKPTPERLKKAREEGRTAVSAEMSSGMMITVLLVVLALMGPSVYHCLVTQLRQSLSFRLDGPLDSATMATVLKAKGSAALTALLPFVIAGAAVSLLSGLVVGGWVFSPKAAKLNFGRISPGNGLKNLLSARSAVHLLVSIAKLIVILLIVYQYLGDKLGHCQSLRYASPQAALVAIARLVFGLIARVAIALLAIGGIDMLWQKWKHKRDLRMTRQEVKEELKQHEMSPEVRGRTRRIQMEMARKRMLQEVPNADVVIANPTHVAVALRYDSKSMAAPTVVAKGADLLCETIKDIAKANGVPIVYRPQLARTIYEAVEPGEAIPESLFVAIAEILAMIYRLRRRRIGAAGGERPQ